MYVDLVLLIGVAWCALLVLVVALLAAASRADGRTDALLARIKPRPGAPAAVHRAHAGARAARAGTGARRRARHARLAAASPQAPEGGEAAAEHEAGNRRSGQHLGAVAGDEPAPVGGPLDLSAQPIGRQRELRAVVLDRGADLLWRARGHRT